MTVAIAEPGMTVAAEERAPSVERLLDHPLKRVVDQRVDEPLDLVLEHDTTPVADR
jgi:hypothetical protein